MNTRQLRADREVTLDGQTLTLAEWARRCGISTSAMAARLRRWPARRALTLVAGSPSDHGRRCSRNSPWRRYPAC